MLGITVEITASRSEADALEEQTVQIELFFHLKQ